MFLSMPQLPLGVNGTPDASELRSTGLHVERYADPAKCHELYRLPVILW